MAGTAFFILGIVDNLGSIGFNWVQTFFEPN